MRYSSRQYAEALSEALEAKQGTSRRDVVRRFLTILSRNRDRKLLPAILRHVERQWLAQNNLAKVEIAAADPIAPALRREIEDLVGKRVAWTEHHDPTLLAGVRIVVDDELLIDATALRQLARL